MSCILGQVNIPFPKLSIFAYHARRHPGLGELAQPLNRSKTPLLSHVFAVINIVIIVNVR